MRDIKTREGFEFWDKLNALPRYAFLLSPSGKRVQKFEDQAMGNWIDVHEAQKVIDQSQEVISELRDELAANPKPDPVLCNFYDVADWPGLVRELVGHVAQLQDSAKRNVKPWEDTFPPTLLPAYIDRVNADNAATKPDVELVAVEYQYRQRPLWRKDDNSGWMPWMDCSPEVHANYTASPELHYWQYETRTLYAGPNQL